MVCPVDKLFKDFNLLPPTKIKIDVDGNEDIVFEGAKKTISQAKEIYFEENGMKSDKKIINEILSFGFSIKEQTKSNVGDINNPVGKNTIFIR